MLHSQIGFQTSRYNKLALSDELCFAAKNKVRFFEIFFDGFLPQNLSANDVSALEKHSNLFIYTIHCPIGDYIEYPEFMPQMIGFTKRIKAKIFTVHFDKLSFMTIEKISRELQNNIIFSIENTAVDFNEFHKLKYIDFMKSAIKTNKISATFDAGHSQISMQNPIEFLKKIIGNSINIAEIHAHNNDGISDSHSALNTGIINFAKITEILRSKNFSIPFIIEHWEKNTDSLQYLLEIDSKIRNH